MNKGKSYYFLIGCLIGIAVSIVVVAVGVKALRYFRQGEGLGYAKAYVKTIFEKVGASQGQAGRFKSGGRNEKIEVIKELILAQKERLFGAKKEKKFPLLDAKNKSRETSYDIIVASSLDRIFPEGFVLKKPTVGKSIGLMSAKREREDFQVVVIGGKNILKSVHLEFTDLKNQAGTETIGREHITWRVVGSVPTQKPYYPVKYVGLWPDPLLPSQPIDVYPGMTQPFWVTIYTPLSTKAGNYRGAVRVLAGNTVLTELPVFLKVYDFALSMEGHLKTAFDFYGHITGSRYPKASDETEEGYQMRMKEINERFLVDMLIHRIDPVLNIDPTSEEDMDRVEKYRQFGLNNFSIGSRGGTFNNNWPRNDEELEGLKDLYRGYSERLIMSGLLDYIYIYAWDEGEIGAPIVQKVTKMLHEASPKLKTMVCYHGFWNPSQYPGWGDDIDIWCFQIDNFNEARMKDLKNRGKEIWMYVSGPGGSGSPNLAIDFDTMDYRIIPWMCWKYGIQGFLYWCVNWWPYSDPYKTAANTKWSQNGNGLLFYPGENGPVDSLRLEIFRDGMEDYEYFYLLSETIRIFKEKGLEQRYPKTVAEAQALLKFDQNIITSVFSFTKDNSVLLERRAKIADLIEKMNKILKEN